MIRPQNEYHLNTFKTLLADVVQATLQLIYLQVDVELCHCSTGGDEVYELGLLKLKGLWKKPVHYTTWIQVRKLTPL